MLMPGRNGHVGKVGTPIHPHVIVKTADPKPNCLFVAFAPLIIIVAPELLVGVIAPVEVGVIVKVPPLLSVVNVAVPFRVPEYTIKVTIDEPFCMARLVP
jgi:hypothetical protein